MKRKIAILLSAMMVTSAMPLSASAAQLKSDSVQNTTFAKSGDTIDPEAKNYKDYDDENELRSRRSVLKINLNNDSTDSIQKGTSFNVKLTNGKFGDFEANTNMSNVDFANLFGYRNVGVTYNDVKDLTSLKDVYSTISKSTTAKFDIDKEIVLVDNQEIPAIKALSDKLNTINPGSTEPQGEDLSHLITFLGNTYEGVLNMFKSDLEGSAGAPSLLHIPYNIELISPTEARITTLQELSNGDQKINVPSSVTVDTSKLQIEFYDDQGKIDQYQTNASRLKNTKYIKVVNKDQNDKGVKKESKDLENPYIALPLGGVIADGNGAVKATVVADYNDKVVGGEYTITKGLEEGSTSLVYDANNVKSFEDKVKIDSLTLKENVRNTIGKDTDTNDKDKIKDSAEIILRVSGGFSFKSPSITVTDASGANDLKTGVTTEWVNKDNSNAIKVTIDKKLLNRKNPIGLDFSGIEIEPNSDKNYGDVEISVSGDGISGQTIKVAQREKLGFKVETLKDPKEIISGRHYNNDKLTMVEDDNTTVEVKFSEAVPNTLVTTRALDFTVPDGVKIVDVELGEFRNFTGLDDADFEIINNGKTLRLKRTTDDKNPEYKVNDRVKSLASFNMKFNLSVDPAFTGDIKLSVVGGGQNEGSTPDTLIAKAVAPFEIKTQTTKVDLGYQDYNTADIVITETKPGMFLEGKQAVLNLVAPYGTQEVGFSEAKFDVTGGELEVKEKAFKVNNGAITFDINKASYKNPSTITIKNVKIGSTRSVPFGSYSLSLSGKAVINNYDDAKNIADDKSFALTATGSKDNANLINQSNTSYYAVKDYVNVVTETGTLNQTVKVSVGEKTVLVGDKAIDMDVAPYIQASSNSTMVPLRFVSVALGVDSANVSNPDESNKVTWDANSKTTTIYYGAGTGQKIIQFQAGSNIMVVDGTRIPMEYGVKAEIKDGRMFVPFRALGQALGIAVTWDANTRTAIYNENNARNANATTTATTTETTTTASSSTTETTTSKESSTESTTASKDSTTETTTVKK
ncbi:MAG: copper amine oxidase N-terminal domain-containing protein [Lachnospirales bacterium]